MSNVIETMESTSRAEVPQLRPGDRLTRDEFYRRWEAMPELKHAERIEGIVSMQQSVRHAHHGGPHSQFVGLLWYYALHTPGTEASDNSTIQVGQENDLQPDASLRVLPDQGGQSRTTEKGYIEGAPEFAVEISASSKNVDLGRKLHAYEKAGVLEYVVWTVIENEVKWFRRIDDEYELVTAVDGILHSESFPGFHLNARALVDGDGAAVLSTLQAGLDTPEHAAFVERLAAAKSD